MSSKVANKNILLLGGTAGISLTVAKEALQSGANISVTSSSEDRVQKALKTLSATTPDAPLHQKKLGETIENLLKFTAELSPIDHIVFTAGNIPPLVPLANASFCHFKIFLTVRFFGAMAVGKYAPKYMANNRCSPITLTNGAQSQKPTFWGLAVTVAPVRVNAVSPGFIDTDLHQGLSKEIHDGAIKKYSEQSLTNDVGYPEDAAEAYIYLMKDYFTTGTIAHTSVGGVGGLLV
ncbi:NAD(P)-binding protein [Aspergillus alliaceus]|uniref:NAD(P)-binding protein n=1 Tax=Petromyces alliaceus TaxID=209559 RepID=A0A5N7BS52_PETAA|nr:NAD(P)-binding protein [Aspergillus alliaceus]